MRNGEQTVGGPTGGCYSPQGTAVTWAKVIRADWGEMGGFEIYFRSTISGIC